jgi:N-hydroxyarylamine O-acetyltransferase
VQLDGYLERIGYDGPVEPTLACLTAIHRRHATRIPYENLDVQLGVPVGQDREQLYDKLVVRRRGGWCYEMNGLLQGALEAIGFDVRRVAGGVHRHETGDRAVGNHLVLVVRLDRDYVADLGLGDGLREPVPLTEGSYRQGPFTFRLERVDDGYWRVWNRAGGDPEAFDFRDVPADEELLAAQCHRLQTSSESGFVQNLACQQMAADGVVILQGRVLTRDTPAGRTKELLGSAGELEDALARDFGIAGVDVASLWPKVAARHEVVFGDRDPV